MPETASPLDSRLRAFFGEIKTQGVPQSLAGFRPARVRSRQRALNLFAGTVGVAVVAAGVTLFAVELTGGHNGSPIGGSVGQSLPTPSPQATLPILPAFPPGPGAYYAVNPIVLIPKTYGSGTETLPTVTVGPHERIGIDYGCLSPQSATTPSIRVAGRGMPVAFQETLNGQVFRSVGVLLSRCANPTGDSGTELTAMSPGGALTVGFEGDPSVRWVILVYEFTPAATPGVTPTLPPSASSPTAAGVAEGVAPPGATVVLPVTYGTGPAQLPAFNWAANDMLYVEYGCGSGDTVTFSDGVVFSGDSNVFDGDFSTSRCSGPADLGAGGTLGGGAGGPVSLTVKAAPSLQWVIFIYEAPPGLLGPGP